MILEKLRFLEKESIEKRIPIIGSLKGKWLLDKVKELKPKNVLELGTANGYSGIILGSEGAEIVTIEIDSKIAEEAKENFSKFGINAEIIIGDAKKLLEKVSSKEKFDLIYIDFFKKGYLQVLEDCIGLGKVIIADNISFEGCKDFKEKILKDERLKTEIVDIEDGLSYSEVK
jgi:predicted O-methyltransferase YrrM